MPSDEEISGVRRLIDRVTADLDQLTAEDRAQIEQAVASCAAPAPSTSACPALVSVARLGLSTLGSWNVASSI
ncbi:hypothetical protein J7E99_19580 [Streptomyces sp. ISL-44]|uniref:hypothetical protein n=1 Tax=Streptomyces sp. ISL-44 TaxID=2819184 RepID=UPI001BE6C500|nr:hypothetical protein [Streptomyces sp. ISL-44]MBT2542855.1 hypothetical protein [Streptomyces sp. ISL-44]